MKRYSVRCGLITLLAATPLTALPAASALPPLDQPTSIFAPDGRFAALTFSHDGRSLVVFRAGGGAEVLDWPSGRLASRMPIERPEFGPLAVSSEGTIAAGGPRQTSILLWRPPAPQAHRRIESPGAPFDAIALSADGHRLATGDHDGRIALWNSMTGAKERERSGHIASVNALAFSPDGLRLASAANDNDVCIWNAATGELVHRIDSLSHSVFTLAWPADGRLYIGGASGRVTQWDPVSWKPLHESARLPQVIASLAVSGDGSTVGVGGVDPGSFRYPADVWLLDGVTLEERRRIRAHSGVVVALAFSPDGRFLATTSISEAGIKCWELPAR